MEKNSSGTDKSGKKRGKRGYYNQFMHGGQSDVKIPRTSKQRLTKKIKLLEVDHHHHIEENQADDSNPTSSNPDETQQINLIKENPPFNPETIDHDRQYDSDAHDLRYDSDVGLKCDVIVDECQQKRGFIDSGDEVIISLSDIEDTHNQYNNIYTYYAIFDIIFI